MAPRTHNKLTDATVKAAKPGKHGDGGSLYLNVTSQGTRSWLFVYIRNGRRREMGLGAYPAISLAKARSRAQRNRELLADGRDPINERRIEVAVPTFGEAANDFVKDKLSNTTSRHRRDWKHSIRDYAKPLRDMPVNTIRVEDVLKVLNPIWREKAVMAGRLRGRIERVLDYARAREWRNGENPARWRGGLDAILASRSKRKVRHHPAMPFEKVPEFMVKLREAEGMDYRALEFTILTATRSNEVFGAKWSEFDLDAALWTIPAERMKADEEQRVPLSDRALEIVKELSEARLSDYVFPGMYGDRPLSHMSLLRALRGLGVEDATVHGFRSSFRDWASEKTNHAWEVAEVALAHSIGDETSQAYQRGDLLEKRRKLMSDWCEFVSGEAKTDKANDEAEALEIVESLRRQDLTAQERREQVERLAALWGKAA